MGELGDEQQFEEKFRKEKEIARGHFGVVFRVIDLSNKEVRAAKIIKCIKQADVKKVKDEIAIMKSLKHPNLLGLINAYSTPKSIIIVTEFVSGGELFDRVVSDDVDLTEKDCRDFLRQICEGVAYMHQCNVAHLDLKPENILCVNQTSRNIKLIDFGLARKLEKGEPIKVMMGTTDYVAPEVVNFDPISLASDMWAVGVIAYILLSGLSPFAGDTDQETFVNISSVAYDFDDEAFDDISSNAKDFISSLLKKDQKKRLSVGQCITHKWLASKDIDKASAVIKKDNLRTFNTKRKWKKTGNAIRAIGRLSLMGKSEDT